MKSTCFGCDYFYDENELATIIDHQYGKINLCQDCKERVGA